MSPVPGWLIGMIGLLLALVVVLCVLGIRGWYPRPNSEARPDWVPPEMKAAKRKRQRRGRR